MKIAYFGFDFFYTCLEFLSKEHEVTHVFSSKVDNKKYNFNTRVLEKAKQIGAKTFVGKPSKNQIQELIDSGVDLIVSAAYGYKIPLLSKMPKTVNIHPTLLPDGRGPWPFPLIILKKLKKSGVTLHKLDKDFDTGEILLQESLEILSNENLETLSLRKQVLAKDLLKKFLEDLDFYRKNSKAQKGGSYWNFPSEEEQTLDFNSSTEEIDLKLRAFGKLESCAFFDGIHRVVSHGTSWKEKHSFEPGELVHKSNLEALVATKEGFVCFRNFEKDPDYN